MPLCSQKHFHRTTLYADAGQLKDHWDRLMREGQESVPVLQCYAMRTVRASIGRENSSPFDVEYGCWCHLAGTGRKNASRVLKLFRPHFQVNPMQCLPQQIWARRQV